MSARRDSRSGSELARGGVVPAVEHLVGILADRHRMKYRWSIGEERHGDSRIPAEQRSTRDRVRPEALSHLIEGGIEVARAAERKHELDRMLVVEVGERDPDQG